MYYCIVFDTSKASQGQPFVNPVFATPQPATTGDNDPTPRRLSGAWIMGLCTVAVLFTGLLILGIIVCTWKKKEKPIDLTKSLILTEEVGKKKKRKDKKKKKDATLEEMELMPHGIGDAGQVVELPPRNLTTTQLPTDPKDDSESEETDQSSTKASLESTPSSERIESDSDQ